jgi:hypothetical protein
MRTKEQSYMMRLPPNGEYDWPDYKAFEMCPICCQRAKPGTDNRYWFLYHTMMQMTLDGVATRFICRLTCEECFEEITEGTYLQCTVGDENYSTVTVHSLPLLDVVEGQGPITWLRDGAMGVRTMNESVCMNAYTLYHTWEWSGAWQSLSDSFGEELVEMTEESGRPSIHVWNQNKADDPSEFWDILKFI